MKTQVSVEEIVSALNRKIDTAKKFSHQAESEGRSDMSIRWQERAAAFSDVKALILEISE
jgi:hypothetical protein